MAERGGARRLAPILAANVLFGAGLFAHAFLYNFYLSEAGHGPGVMGNAAAALTAGGLAALVPAGILVDRIGARAGYGVAATLAAAGLAAGAVATASAPVYGAAFLAGAGTATWRVSMAPLLLSVTAGPLRTRALSWNVALLVGSGALWTALAGAGPARLEAGLGVDAAMALRLALLAGAAATVLAGPVIALAPRTGRAASAPGSAPAVRRLRGVPAWIWPAVGLVALWMTGSALVLPFFNLFFTDVHDLSVGRAGAVLAASQALTALAVAAGGEAAARLGPGRALTAWMLLFPPALFALAAMDALPLAIGFFLLQGFVPAATNPLIDQVLLERAPPERHGVVSSARNGATEASGLVGASLGGRILELGSFPALLVTAGVVAAAGAAGLTAWVRRAQGSPTPAEPSDTRPRSSRHIRSA